MDDKQYRQPCCPHRAAMGSRCRHKELHWQPSWWITSFPQMSEAMSISSQPLADSAHGLHFLAVLYRFPRPRWELILSCIPSLPTRDRPQWSYRQISHWAKCTLKTPLTQQLTTIQLGLVPKAKLVCDPDREGASQLLGRNRLLAYYRMCVVHMMTPPRHIGHWWASLLGLSKVKLW